MRSDTFVHHPSPEPPAFYTVAETAKLLRVDPATLYRAIREGAFPAIRVRSRYVVPAAAVRDMADRARETHSCVDVAVVAAERRHARDVERVSNRLRH
jgi:excisionase family DNA binding protein